MNIARLVWTTGFTSTSTWMHGVWFVLVHKSYSSAWKLLSLLKTRDCCLTSCKLYQHFAILFSPLFQLSFRLFSPSVARKFFQASYMYVHPPVTPSFETKYFPCIVKLDNNTNIIFCCEPCGATTLLSTASSVFALVHVSNRVIIGNLQTFCVNGQNVIKHVFCDFCILELTSKKSSHWNIYLPSLVPRPLSERGLGTRLISSHNMVSQGFFPNSTASQYWAGSGPAVGHGSGVQRDWNLWSCW